MIKGQNDPRLGPGGNKPLAQNTPTVPVTGANCK